jgi:hypothetical protein
MLQHNLVHEKKYTNSPLFLKKIYNLDPSSFAYSSAIATYAMINYISTAGKLNWSAVTKLLSHCTPDSVQVFLELL